MTFVCQYFMRRIFIILDVRAKVEDLAAVVWKIGEERRTSRRGTSLFHPGKPPTKTLEKMNNEGETLTAENYYSR